MDKKQLKIPTNFLRQFQQIPDDWNFENYCKNHEINDQQKEEIKNFCKKWLEDYAEELGDNAKDLDESSYFYEEGAKYYGHTYESLMKGLKKYSEDKILDLHFWSSGMIYTRGWTNNADLFAWVCYEIVTGETVKEKDNFFRCSC
jgi:hypothetical protein